MFAILALSCIMNNTIILTNYKRPLSNALGIVADFEVRLMQDAEVSTSSWVGRVEVRPRGSTDPWGTVCSDMWDTRDAQVICRMIQPG